MHMSVMSGVLAFTSATQDRAPTVSCCSTQTCPSLPVRARNAELHVAGIYQSNSPCLASVRSCLLRACPARPKFHMTIQQA